MTVVELIREHALHRSSAPALLIDAGGGTRKISYGELAGIFDGHAKRLRAEGVAPGDRCGLVAKQGRGFVELALGILAADGCLVPIPDDHAGPRLDEFAQRARLHHIAHDDWGFQLESFAGVEPVDGAGDEKFRALRPAYLRFTSGTTHRRKGVILGHAAVLERLTAANRALDIGPDDRVLWLLPMAHHFVVSILLYLSRGAAILLPADSLARTALELAQREAATVLYASPHHYNLMASDTSDLGLPAARLVVSTADGLREDVATRFTKRFGRPVVQALGIIEVGLPVANLRAAASKPEALGRPLPDYDVWLRGEDGAPVENPTAPERSGEICIRGPGLLDGYLDPWLPAGEILEPDGFRTGDQGWLDADGDLHLLGRRVNRINMAGMKFFVEEVEAILDAHPAVRECRVYAREHAHLGEIPAAEVVAEDRAHPPERRELTRHCRDRLPAYMVPREFRLVEALSKTSSGKVRRTGEE